MPTRELTAREYSSLAEFRFRLRRFLAFSEEQARAAGLNPQQHQLLLAVKGFGTPGPSIGALAERLLLRHHSTVELIDRLERRGMLRRTRAAGDRRLASVSITPSGERVLGQLSLAHRDELKRTGPELSESLAALLKTRRARAPRRAAKKS